MDKKWYLGISTLLHLMLLILIGWQAHFSESVPAMKDENPLNNMSTLLLGETPHHNQLISPTFTQSLSLENTPPTLPIQNAIPVLNSHSLTRIQKVPPLSTAPQTPPSKKSMKDHPWSALKMASSPIKTIKARPKTRPPAKKTIKLLSSASHNSFQKTLQNQMRSALPQQLLKESTQLNHLLKKSAEHKINQYKAFILKTISTHWLIPPHANKQLSCQLLIRINPQGTVLDVMILKPSGDLTLDRSARIAVLKSSPLPVPKDQQTFAAFKQFTLTVKPESLF